MTGRTRAQHEVWVRRQYKIVERQAFRRYGVLFTRTPGWSASAIVARAATKRGAKRIRERLIRRDVRAQWFG